MTQTEKQKMMLTAPVEGLICRMAVPTIISMLITALYNMADTYFVGKLGSNAATGAVGVALPLMAIIQATGFFFGHGSGNSISRHLGAGDVEDAETLAVCGFAGAIGTGLIICVLGQLLIEPLSLLLGSTATILPYAKEYMRYILFAAPYMTAALVLNNQLRLQGNANFAMIGITSGAVLNVALDPLFIFTFDMGVAGAAAATALSQLVSFVILLWALKRAGCVPLRFRYVRCMPSVIGQIFGGGAGWWMPAASGVQLRRILDNDPKRAEKLLRQLDAQQEYTLSGPAYARPKGHAGEPVGRLYNMRSFSIESMHPFDERSSGPELTDWVKAGFQFLLPFYQLFEQAYGMAD